MTRRQSIAMLGAAAMLARDAHPQAAAEKDGGPKAGRCQTAPRRADICGFSGNLAKVPYAQLGLIAQQIGYEGIDLTVMQGGHVDPRITNVDLVRAIESVRGPGLEVPMISTNVTSMSDPTAYAIMAITGHTQVHLFRLGYWPYGLTGNSSSADIARRLAQVRADLANVVQYGQRTEMVAMFPTARALMQARRFGMRNRSSVIWIRNGSDTSSILRRPPQKAASRDGRSRFVLHCRG